MILVGCTDEDLGTTTLHVLAVSNTPPALFCCYDMKRHETYKYEVLLPYPSVLCHRGLYFSIRHMGGWQQFYYLVLMLCVEQCTLDTEWLLSVV